MTIMKKLTCLGIMAALGAITYVVVPADAEARSVGAFIGSARFGSQTACFYEAEGGPIQSSCSGTASWVIPIVYDNSGSTTIRVSARGANSGTRNVSCRAFSANSTGALTIGTERHTVRNDGVTEFLQPSVFAQGFGGAWVTCGMDQGTRLFNVHH
jgi:hypothetical protein